MVADQPAMIMVYVIMAMAVIMAMVVVMVLCDVKELRLDIENAFEVEGVALQNFGDWHRATLGAVQPTQPPSDNSRLLSRSTAKANSLDSSTKWPSQGASTQNPLVTP